MIAGRTHRMLVVHNDAGSGHRIGMIEPKPLRRFALGSLLAYADEVCERLAKPRMLECHCLALSSEVLAYGKEQLEGIARGEKFDSVLCHLVLDHGGVLTDEFLETLRADFLKPEGLLLNPVKSIAKDEVARSSEFGLATDTAPCVIKKNDNYNLPETVLQISTEAELEAWRGSTPAEEQARFVVHKMLRYFGSEQSGMFQLERWIVVFDDLTVNHRCSDEFYIKSATSLSYFARDERQMSRDLRRLAESGYDWKGRLIDCSYENNSKAWDARYAVLQQCREAFRFHYAELDVIRPSENEFVVIDVNQTPGPHYKNVYFRELAVRLLADGLGIRSSLAVAKEVQGAALSDLQQVEEAQLDPKLLEEELARDPNNAHNRFLLAQAYLGARQFEQALLAYNQRLAMAEGPEEERFLAQLEVGRISIHLELAEPAIVGALLGAYILRPQRAEPLYELARYHRTRKNYATATLFAKSGAQMRRPSDRLSVSESIYAWQLLDELGVSAYFVGDNACAKSSWEAVLARVRGGLSIPPHDLERIRENLSLVSRGVPAAPGLQRLS